MRTPLRVAAILILTASACGKPKSTNDPEPTEAPAGPATVEVVKYDAETEARIERIIHDIRRPGPRPGEWGPPQSLADVMKQVNLPGLSVAVIDHGKIAWARGFGVRRHGETTPVDTQTLFQAGSISKPVFAAAVMRMDSADRIDIDADVNDTLESWKIAPVGEWQPRVTLRNLMTHSAGLTVHGFPGYDYEAEQPTVPQILKGEFPANTQPVIVDALPGLQSRYSGGGITVGQLLVTELEGRPFPEVMHEWALEPFGMSHSTFEQPLPAEEKRWAASAHTTGGRPIEGDAHVYPEMAAAGLWTTPTDLATFGLSVARAAEGDADLPLTPDAAREMLTPQTAKQQGIGFFLTKQDGFGHGGVDEGFEARLHVESGGERGVVVMINANRGPIIHLVIQAIAREYEWPDPPQPEPPKEVLTTKYVGRYEARPDYVLEVVAQNGELRLVAPGQSPLPLTASGKHRFFVPSTRIELTFELGEKDETANALTVTQGRGPVRAARVVDE